MKARLFCAVCTSHLDSGLKYRYVIRRVSPQDNGTLGHVECWLCERCFKAVRGAFGEIERYLPEREAS